MESFNKFFKGVMLSENVEDDAGVQFMDFPANEISDLKKRLVSTGKIGTTRISSERGKYEIHEFIQSPFGELMVKKIVSGDSVEDHPHLDELTDDWKEQIGNNPFDYLELGRPEYSPPAGRKYLEQNYPHLLKDPIHGWRANTGIELIHKEPTKKELRRILRNWELMSPEQKRISDEKSLEMFGMKNLEHAEWLKDND